MVENEIQTKVAVACKTSTKEADKLLLEYMQKRNLTIEDLQGHIMMKEEQDFSITTDIKITSYWYKSELILSVIQTFEFKSPSVARSELQIKKGDW
jgi:hypothetical protein